MTTHTCDETCVPWCPTYRGTMTESAPMSVADFLKLLDAQKADSEAVRHDPAEAARVIRKLARDNAEMRALLMTLGDIAGEASADHQTYDFKARAESAAQSVQSLLARVGAP